MPEIDWPWILRGLSYAAGVVVFGMVLAGFGALASWVGRKTGFKIGD